MKYDLQKLLEKYRKLSADYDVQYASNLKLKKFDKSDAAREARNVCNNIVSDLELLLGE